MQFKKRKWGWYLVIFDRAHFKLKILYFKKGKELSYQFHNLRSELWLILRGAGKVRGNDYRVWKNLKAGDYFLAMKGGMHQYRADKNTWAIEAQFGDKCIETDIVRID